MAQAQAAMRQQPGPPAEQPKPPKKRGLVFYAVILLLLAVPAAGGAWFFFGQQTKTAAKPAGPAKDAPPVFFALDTFTVNLVPEFGDQYLQVDITLKVAESKTIDSIKMRMPEVRNRVLLLLSSKRASELTTVPGKNALAEGVRAEINLLIDPQAGAAAAKIQRIEVEGKIQGAPQDPAPAPVEQKAAPAGPVRDVLFTSFIIQ